MNKVFKSVWNASLGVWVAVSETAAGQKKGSNKLKKAAANAVATVVVGAAAVASTGAMAYDNGFGKVTGTGAIAIGSASGNATATGNNTTAIGTSSTASGQGATAVGKSANAAGQNATSIGQDAKSVSNSLAVGGSANATGAGSTALGVGSKAQFDNSLAIGNNVESKGKNAIAIGANAIGADAIAVGGTATGADAISIGGEVLADKAISLGNSTIANEASYSVAIGYGNRINSEAKETFILGSNITTNMQNSVLLGNKSELTEVYTSDIVSQAKYTYTAADGTTQTGTKEVAFAGLYDPTKTEQVQVLDKNGDPTFDSEGNAIFENRPIANPGAVSVGAVGAERQIQNVGAGRILVDSTDAVNGSQLYYVLSEAKQAQSDAAKPINFVNVDKDGQPLLDGDGKPQTTAVKLGDTFNIQGAKVTLDADGNPILSVDAAAAASWNIASGDVAQASSVGGNANTVNFVGGDNVTVAHSELKDKDGNVIGTQVDVKLADQIQLTENGGLTIAGVPELDPNTGFALTDPNTGLPIYQAGKAPITINQGNVNFGGNVISGVAPGVAGTDAVNVDQLKGSGWGLGNATVLDVAGNVVTDANGQPVTTAKINPDDQVEHKAGASNNVTVNTTVQKVEMTDENGQKVLVDKATVTVDLADQIDLTEKGGLTIAGGGEFNLLDADGKPIQATDADGKPLTNLDGSPQYLTYTPDAINLQQGNVSFGGNQIHDVAAGSALTDAVNVSQLKDAVDTLGGGAGVNPDGTIKAPEYTVGAGNQKVDNVGAALDVLNQGFTLTSSNATGAADEQIQAGDTIDITVTKDKNLEVTQTGNKIEFALADDIKLTDQGALTIGNVPGTQIQIKQGDVSFGGNQIHNVAAGTAPTDAVNVSQLQSAGWNVITQDKDAAGNVTGTTENAVNGDKAANNSSVQFNGDNNLSVSQTSKEVKDKDGNVVGTETVIAVELDKDVNLSADGSLTIGDTLVNNDGLSIAGIIKQVDPTTGLPIYEQGRAPIIINQGNVNFGGNVIGGVATGVKGDDAVNVDQLKDEIGKAVGNSGWNLTTNANNSTNKVTPEFIASDASVDFTGDKNITVSNNGADVKVELNPNLDLGKDGSVAIGDTLLDGNGLTVGDITIQEGNVDFAGDQLNNVGTATEDHQAVNLGQLKDELGGLENTINKNIDESIANSGWNLTGKDAAGNTVTEKVNPDDVVEFVAGPSGNTTVTTETTANGAKVTVDIADQLNLTEQGGLTIAGGGVFNALDANGNPIQAKDADGKPLTNPDGSPQYVTYTPDAITIQQGNVSVGGNQIHNVAAGTAGTDAVNVDQLKGAVNIFGGGAAVNPDGSIQAPTYNVNGGSYNNVGDALGALNQADIDLGDRVTNLQQSFNNRIDDVEDRMSAGIAAAMALETAPYVPGKYTYAAATAYHNGQAALGVTLRKTADNGRWSLTGGVAAGTEGEPSVRLGVSGIID